jgi:ABC-type uncharacterized transport system ATPase subunit
VSDAAALTLDRITKRFGSATALDDVTFTLRRGSIHALLGENGAGKTTLMRVAFGLLRPDAGTIFVDGATVTMRSPADAILRGIGMVQQHYSTVPAMTVAENIALGGRGRFDATIVAASVAALSARVGLPLDPNAVANTLSVAEQQRLEIVKSLAHSARTLILDEPSAVLAPAESRALLRWLREFADGGAAIVLITHRLGEALEIADDITVLRHGRVVLQTPARAATAASLADAMLGGTLGQPGSDRRPPPAVSDVVARATDVAYKDDAGIVRLQRTSFELRSGEVVGVAGVDGSGHRELLLALAGRLAPSEGTLTVPERPAFVPEDRHQEALVLDFTVTENLALRHTRDGPATMPWRALAQAAAHTIREFDIRGASPSTPVAQLSGGNQQKLVLGRELIGNPRLVVAINPTRGLDIRAAAAVRSRLRAASEAGAAVVVYSTDLDELLGLASRLLVVHAGTVVETPLDRTLAGAAMLGAA